MKKTLSLRSAVIAGVSLAAGSTAGTTAETISTVTGHPLHGAGHVVVAAVTLWFAEKLDRVIDDEDGC